MLATEPAPAMLAFERQEIDEIAVLGGALVSNRKESSRRFGGCSHGCDLGIRASQGARPSKLIYALTRVDAQASYQVRSEYRQRKQDDCDYVSQPEPSSVFKKDEMSHSVSDQDASVLGKRAHGGSPQKPEDDVAPGPAEEDDDEDDVGPMPLPADASSNEGARKKRKGRLATVCPVE